MTDQTNRAALRDAAVALALVIGSACTMYLAWGYGLGSFQRPGPGGFPFVLSAGLFVSSVVAFWPSMLRIVRLRQAAGPREVPPAGDSRVVLGRAAVFVAILVVWTVLMRPLGFAAASVLCVAAVDLLNGQRSILRAALFACALTAGCYLLFVEALGLPL